MANKYIQPPKELRGRWYLLVGKQGKSVQEVCTLFGMSRKTYYKWYGRDHPVGMTGKRPRKMHPHSKLVGHIRVVVEAKMRYNFGPQKMSIYLKKTHGVAVSPSTIYKFYKKKKLIRKPQKQQQWYHPLKTPYDAEFPGENVQLDVKYVPGADLSWNYQYRFIDTVTNMQYATTMETKDALATITAFKQAKKSFPFSITGIQTDNGGEFRGRFHDYLVKKKIVQRYIPKRSTPWNGKVERANRSIDDAYYLNPTRPWKTVPEYTRWYNHERPHLGKQMNGLTPEEKYVTFMHKCHP